MFFKKNIQPQNIENANAPMLAHLDSPTGYPSATLFRVSGWVVCNAPIESIKVGNEVMQLSKRDDVLKAHPNYAYASGFSGLARESDLSGQLLTINASTGTEEYTVNTKLGRDIMLSLSKGEKLAKLKSIFPDDDPEQLIDKSRTVEVADDDTTKFALL